jgi:hypothetical protein
MQSAIFSIAINLFHAEAMVGQLIAEGCSIHSISLVLCYKDVRRDFIHELNNTPERITTRAGAGSVLPGILEGLGPLSVVIGGPVSLIAAGPVVTTLNGRLFNEGGNCIAGSLAGLGMREFQAECYEVKIKEGNILVCVDPQDGGESQRALQIFERFAADDVSTGQTAAVA